MPAPVQKPVQKPPYSVKLGWNKLLKRNDKVIVRVTLTRIPADHVAVDVQKTCVKVNTLKNTKKFAVE